ncbi:MAG: hypothetical protein AAFU79_28840 [Myxococcota bacterium]
MPVATADLDFRDAFEAGQVVPADFDHRAHLRLAYVYLSTLQDEDEAFQRMQDALLSFLERNGVDAAKFHVTMTKAWLRAVRLFMARAGATPDAAAFLDQSAPLLDANVMLTHYSKERLASEAARTGWTPPDLEPIPDPPLHL